MVHKVAKDSNPMSTPSGMPILYLRKSPQEYFIAVRMLHGGISDLGK